MTARVLITCEHGGNIVPPRYRRLFAGRQRLLHCHRGWDPGALDLARELARELNAPLIACTVTRLLVDLNRSRTNPGIWSVISATLDRAERRRVLDAYYTPYRDEVLSRLRVAAKGRAARAVHLSVHTFAPVLRAVRREVDIGVLFDPEREMESRIAHGMLRELNRELPDMRVRANEPYRGTDDGLTTALRLRLAEHRYAGIELEVNQRFARAGGRRWAELRRRIAHALARATRT